jgi:hypothetical protein
VTAPSPVAERLPEFGAGWPATPVGRAVLPVLLAGVPRRGKTLAGRLAVAELLDPTELCLTVSEREDPR